MKQEQQAPAPSNAFLQVMQTHDGGEICNELADAMREATQAVVLSGKASTVEFKVKFTPAARGAFGVVFSKPQVKKSEPERASSIWFGDEHGNLHRNDPRQKELPLRSVQDPQQVAEGKVVADPLKQPARAVNQ